MMQSCPVCGSVARSDVLSLPGLPVLINAQVSSASALDVRRGDIDLVVCEHCGHLYNRSFDDQLLDYDASYENTLHYSPKFREFAEGLAERLIADHALTGTNVAELGSGPGHFLEMLCERGASRGDGFDPSYDPERLGAPRHPAVTISTEMFPNDGSLPVELVVSQHVLEHLHEPVVAIEAQRRAVEATAGVVYNEVPNGALMLEQCALWDLIYEHLSYFTPTSFQRAHELAGLHVERSGAAFGEQFMWAESRAAESAGRTADEAAVLDAVEDALAFGQHARQRIESARTELVELSARGPVVLWGAGSKGATYLNLVHDVAPISGVVDINPRKDGWGVPGTSLTITGPSIVSEVRPRTVLVANPVYRDEIGAQVAELGVDAEIRPLWG